MESWNARPSRRSIGRPMPRGAIRRDDERIYAHRTDSHDNDAGGITKGHRESRLANFVLLSDGEGPFTLSVEIWCSEAGPLFKEAPIVRSDPFRITIPHRLTVVELAFELVDVPMPRPGLYEFRIKADGHEIDGETAFLRVLPGELP